MLAFRDYNETIQLNKGGGVDDWGVKRPTVSLTLPCYIKEGVSESRQHNSKFANFDYEVTCEGKVIASLGDELVMDGRVFKIQKITFSKDLSGTVYATKFFI